MSYFEVARTNLSLTPLRKCQIEALTASSTYFEAGGCRAACLLSVGAGKTALAIAACLKFAHRRALIVTPSNVIRGTFGSALNPRHPGNALFGLSGGPLLAGVNPPQVVLLNGEQGAVRALSRAKLRKGDILVANFQSRAVLSKLEPDDIDFIVVDEAHMAAAQSYQRLMEHFKNAKVLLMSACYRRLDKRRIDANLVYRYRLTDAIIDGHAKRLQVHRFETQPDLTRYCVPTPDGGVDEIVGRSEVLSLLRNERLLDKITMQSEVPMRTICRLVRVLLTRQSRRLRPTKPRVLFSALGLAHARQLAAVATSEGIPCGFVHHSMSNHQVRAIRNRFESPKGDLQGLVHLKMLGQGYDFPPITVVVPMRPYGSFAEFYQFVGRGIRTIQGRQNSAGRQLLDLVFHSELGFEQHLQDIATENDMEPVSGSWTSEESADLGRTRNEDIHATVPSIIVTYEHGNVQTEWAHRDDAVRPKDTSPPDPLLAAQYAEYVQATATPVSFEQYVVFTRSARTTFFRGNPSRAGLRRRTASDRE